MKNKNSFMVKIYMALMFFLTLSGFGQMPIFKRYYIADLPGLGWLAKFYVTHLIHYICATMFLVLAFYAATDYILSRRSKGGRVYSGLTRLAVARVAVIAGLVVSGAVMVYRNLHGIFLPHVFISVVDLVHLGLVMVIMGLGVYGIISGRGAWLEDS